MPRISIIGTGLIGGSLGLALKKAGVKADIIGFSRDYRNAQQARKIGAIDAAVRSPQEAVQKADVVVVATPPLAMRDTFRDIGPHLSDDCIVTDVASTKAQVMAWAAELLPPTAHFVGGHPMAGKEESSIRAADADLFRGRAYCITPSTTAHGQAVKTIVDIVVAVGAKPRFMDPYEHDAFVAGVSHLPFVLSAILADVTTHSSSWREMSPLASSGYRDATRLASGDTTMHRDICLTNHDSIVRWIDEFTSALQRFRSTIEEEDAEALSAVFERAKQARDKWLVKPEVDEELPKPEIESSTDQMSAMLFGHFKMPKFTSSDGQDAGKK